jgi:hypothetical protein
MDTLFLGASVLYSPTRKLRFAAAFGVDQN